MTFFVEHHQSGRDDRFGHRHDRKDRVWGHKLASFLVSLSLRLKMHDFSMLSYERDGASQFLRVDISLHDRVHFL